MKIIILNGNPDKENAAFDGYLNQLAGSLQTQGHKVRNFELRSMDINNCTGCAFCWLKTPGKCVINDETDKILSEFIRSDFALYASPVIMGFTSALLKKITDRSVQLLIPYWELVNNECHNKARYNNCPCFGLLLEKRDDCDDEDIRIITDIYSRISLNFKSELCFALSTSNSITEVRDEINNLHRLTKG